MAHPSLLQNLRELDKRSAYAGTLVSRFVLEHSPVVFPCRFSREDLVILDLVGRYRFPVRVIAWEPAIGGEAARKLRSFLERRYVFSVPVTYVRDDRVCPVGEAADASDAWAALTVQVSGCRAWLSGARGATTLPGVIDREGGRRIVRCDPIADWDDALLAAYVERWELPSMSADAGSARQAA